MNKKGSTSFFMIFVFLAVILLILFALVVPLIQYVNLNLYAAGEGILADANVVAAGIENDAIRAEMVDAIGAESSVIPTSVQALSVFFQYGWIIIIIMVMLVMFIYTRQSVEYEVR